MHTLEGLQHSLNELCQQWSAASQQADEKLGQAKERYLLRLGKAVEDARCKHLERQGQSNRFAQMAYEMHRQITRGTPLPQLIWPPELNDSQLHQCFTQLLNQTTALYAGRSSAALQQREKKQVDVLFQEAAAVWQQGMYCSRSKWTPSHLRTVAPCALLASLKT